MSLNFPFSLFPQLESTGLLLLVCVGVVVGERVISGGNPNPNPLPNGFKPSVPDPGPTFITLGRVLGTIHNNHHNDHDHFNNGKKGAGRLSRNSFSFPDQTDQQRKGEIVAESQLHHLGPGSGGLPPLGQERTLFGGVSHCHSLHTYHPTCCNLGYINCCQGGKGQGWGWRPPLPHIHHPKPHPLPLPAPIHHHHFKPPVHHHQGWGWGARPPPTGCSYKGPISSLLSGWFGGEKGKGWGGWVPPSQNAGYHFYRRKDDDTVDGGHFLSKRTASSVSDPF